MKRLFDLLLVAALLGAGGVGAYFIGHKVDHLSNQAASQDSELNQTTTGTTAVHRAHTLDGHHLTPLLVAGTIAVVLLAFVAAALINAMVKSRRRERWRVSH